MRLKPSCCVSALELNKEPYSQSGFVPRLVTIPCLGQVLTLFRVEASQIVYPVQVSEAKKPHPVQRHVLVDRKSVV